MKKNSPSLFFATLLLLIFSGPLAAQDKSLDQNLYESLHGHGSMNVVFAVIAIILAGLLIFLWRIDRKVAKLENEMKERKP